MSVTDLPPNSEEMAVDPFDRLHPALRYHIVNSLGWSSLRSTQLEAIGPFHDGTHCLLLAPTAGGKTEAAIIPLLSRMLEENWSGVSILYVCPIKALLNNLADRLSHYAGLVGRRVELWHGDISQSRKQRALKDPPDILLTTPESLEGMLVSTRVERQAWFAAVRAVVVDELHAFAVDDRGWHLRAVLSRLEAYAERPPQRIGLSATVRNPESLLTWLAPYGIRCMVGSASVSTEADVTLDYVGSLENAAIVVSRLHRGAKRLVFCDSRSQTERLGVLLRQHGVRTFLSHASLSLAERRQAESAFAEEQNCVIVATSTLELGLDVGDLDHVIQIDAPATVSSFLQRMGRTGRRRDTQRNCLFLATTESAFLLSLGLLHKWSEAWVEAVVPPPSPWGVIAQQAMLLTLEQGLLPQAEISRQLQNAFPELERAGIDTLLEAMKLKGFLDCPAPGVLQIGPRAEREYGRGHYRDLLATFSGAPLLLARFGSTEVGYVDPSVLVGDESPKDILLGGRSWKVVAVDWGRRVVSLEPGSGGGQARWTGAGRVVSEEISQGIRAVMLTGHLPGTRLSKRATERLHTLRDRLPLPVERGRWLISREENGRYSLWTFAGTVANRRLCRQLRSSAGATRFDEMTVQTHRDPTEYLGNRTLDEPISPSELESLSSGLKFAECLPDELLRESVELRWFGGPLAN